MKYIPHKYGEFSSEQIEENKYYLRKQIFFLLLYADPKTKPEYKSINVVDAFNNLLRRLGGMNSILFEPPALVQVIAMLEAALIEYQKPEFDFSVYRKLILDAGNEILRIDENNKKGV